MRLATLCIVVLVGLIAGCAPKAEPVATGAPAAGPVLSAQAITIDAAPVALNASDTAAVGVGELVYAGGLVLTARGTSRLGGLSGLDGGEAGFVAVTDAGDLVRFRARLDADGRLTGVMGASIEGLADESGASLSGRKAEGDAEGLVRLEGGGLIVSFEQRHRVVAYAPDGRASALPAPPTGTLGDNEGWEALAETGGSPGALLVGSEGGRLWRCGADGDEGEACRELPLARGFGDEFRLTGLDRVEGERFVGVFRAFDPLRGPRVVVAELAPDGAGFRARELARLVPPLTVDNIEAVAVVPGRAPGAMRLYLLSDNNFSPKQRTLLLAFDWRQEG